jgi:hypothetical protein
MEDKIKSKPPYPSTGQAEEILDIFRRISPKRIDSKFVIENGIVIRIPNSGLSKEYTINNKEEFNSIFGTELKKIEKIIKINFDWDE